MKKFNVTVTRVDEYEIEVDENIWNEKELKEWEKSFFPVNDQKDLAKILAGSVMKLGSDHGFIEGFGYVRMKRKSGDLMSHFRSGKKGIEQVPDDEYDKGLSVRIIDEDDDYEYDIEEIK